MRVGETSNGVSTFSVAVHAFKFLRAIAALPGVDAGHIAIQGTSLGGFVTTLTAALDDGFDQVFIALAGADLYSMVMKGGQDSARIRRNLRSAGYDDQSVKTLLWAIDPIRVAHRLQPERTWLYTAMFDQVVPANCGAALGRTSSRRSSATTHGCRKLWTSRLHVQRRSFSRWTSMAMVCWTRRSCST